MLEDEFRHGRLIVCRYDIREGLGIRITYVVTEKARVRSDVLKYVPYGVDTRLGTYENMV